jgi:DNA-binding PadR family transcriptional regulator
VSITATKLLVLGVTRLRQPVHGYDVRRELAAWRADQWASIQSGSVYNQLRSLAKQGFIEVASVERDTSRPDRTLYRVTDDGEKEFRRLLEEVLFNPAPQPFDLLPALCFLPDIDPNELKRAITQRIATMKSFFGIYDEHIAPALATSPAPYIQEVFLLTNGTLQAEVEWAQKFLERLENGTYAAIIG